MDRKEIIKEQNRIRAKKKRALNKKKRVLENLLRYKMSLYTQKKVGLQQPEIKNSHPKFV